MYNINIVYFCVYDFNKNYYLTTLRPQQSTNNNVRSTVIREISHNPRSCIYLLRNETSNSPVLQGTMRRYTRTVNINEIINNEMNGTRGSSG